MRAITLSLAAFMLAAVAGCSNKVTTGCLPEGCLATLSCDDPACNVDEDGDGYSAVVDCDDRDPAVHPGAVEICGNHRDDDCDGSIICDGGTVDEDGDDYGSVASGGTDCDDHDAAVHPGAVEICGNHKDDDCDGSSICDGGTTDADSDDYGSVASGGTDCNDLDATIHPGAREFCNGAVDDNCDGSIICDGGTVDADNDGFASVASGGTDCDDTNAAIHPGAVEDCGTGASESCGTDACAGVFSRVPVDAARASALVGAGGGTWILGTDDGRVYRSTNDTASWSPLGSLALGEVTRAELVSTDTVAIGVRRQNTDPPGVWLWTLGSDTLTPAGGFSGLNGGEVTDIAIGTGTPFGLYVTTTGGGLYRSTDGGTTFTPVPGPDLFAYAVITDPVDRTRIVVATDMTVTRSTDDGATFTSTLAEIPVVTRLAAARLALVGDTLYVLFDDGGVYASTDFGLTFARAFASSTSLKPRDLAQDASGTMGLASLDRGYLRSTDQGAIWLAPSTPLGTEDKAIRAFGTSGFILAGSRGPIKVDADASERRARGLDAADLRQVTTGPDGERLIAGGDGTLWVSIDGGAYYHAIDTPAPTLIAAFGLSPSTLVAVGEDGTVLTGDAPFGPMTAVATLGEGPATAAAFDANGRLAVALGLVESRLFVIDAPYTAAASLVGGVSAINIDALVWRNGLLLAGARSGQVLRQTAAGSALSAATTSPTGGGVTSLLTTATGPVYATLGGVTGGLFKSGDGGATFAAAGADTGSTWLTAGCLDPASGKLVLVGYSAVSVSTDAGATWQPLAGVPTGLYGNAVPMSMGCTLASHGADLELWLPTTERGLFITLLP